MSAALASPGLSRHDVGVSAFSTRRGGELAGPSRPRRPTAVPRPTGATRIAEFERQLPRATARPARAQAFVKVRDDVSALMSWSRPEIQILVPVR